MRPVLFMRQSSCGNLASSTILEELRQSRFMLGMVILLLMLVIVKRQVQFVVRFGLDEALSRAGHFHGCRVLQFL